MNSNTPPTPSRKFSKDSEWRITQHPEVAEVSTFHYEVPLLCGELRGELVVDVRLSEDRAASEVFGATFSLEHPSPLHEKTRHIFSLHLDFSSLGAVEEWLRNSNTGRSVADLLFPNRFPEWTAVGEIIYEFAERVSSLVPREREARRVLETLASG